MIRLIVHSPDGRRRSLNLSGRVRIKLGRSDTCDATLAADTGVSREHAEVRLDDDGRVIVRDLDSMNGTRVDEGATFRNEARVARRRILISEHQIEIITGQEESTSSSVTFVDDDPRRKNTTFFPSTRKIDLDKQRLALLMGLTEKIGSLLDRDQLLQEALGVCCDSLGFERGLIVLRDDEGRIDHVVRHNVKKGPDGALMVSRSLIEAALIKGERAIVSNPAGKTAKADRLRGVPAVRAALCVPIPYRSQILGAVYGDRLSERSDYQSAEVDFLAAIAKQVGVALANLQLFNHHVASQRLLAEMARAREIQENLLPDGPLVAGRVEVEGFNRPSSGVSGDYFDYFMIDGTRMGAIVADVTGHGLPAALMMANLQSAFRVGLTSSTSLSHLAERLNRRVRESARGELFITALIAVIDTVSGEIEYVNAGHPAPIVVSGDRADVVEGNKGLPLGIDPEESYSTSRLDRGETLLLYTDGVVEAGSDSGTLVGIEPIVAAVLALEDRSPGNVIRSVLRTVESHLGDAPCADDMTVVALRLT